MGLTRYLSLIFCCIHDPKHEDALPATDSQPTVSAIEPRDRELNCKNSLPSNVHHLSWTSILLILMAYRDQLHASAIRHETAFDKSANSNVMGLEDLSLSINNEDICTSYMQKDL